jgi:hypothetical protein
MARNRTSVGLRFEVCHPFPDSLIPHNVTVSIASLRDRIGRFIPLNRAMRIHVYLGYSMIFLVPLCHPRPCHVLRIPVHSQEQEYCERLTSEIMCTGYAITVVFMIGLTRIFDTASPTRSSTQSTIFFILYIVTWHTRLIICNGATPAHGVKLSTGYQQLSLYHSATGRLRTSIITTRQSSSRLLLSLGMDPRW